jgi:hypothetical protein
MWNFALAVTNGMIQSQVLSAREQYDIQREHLAIQREFLMAGNAYTPTVYYGARGGGKSFMSRLCRNCGAPPEPGDSSCSYCRSPH